MQQTEVEISKCFSKGSKVALILAANHIHAPKPLRTKENEIHTDAGIDEAEETGFETDDCTTVGLLDRTELCEDTTVTSEAVDTTGTTGDDGGVGAAGELDGDGATDDEGIEEVLTDDGAPAVPKGWPPRLK